MQPIPATLVPLASPRSGQPDNVAAQGVRSAAVPGRSQDGSGRSQDGPAAGASVAAVTQSKIAVLGILLLVTGALGLPLLWINKRFNTFERVFWSLVMIVYTALMIGVTIAILTWAYRLLLG